MAIERLQKWRERQALKRVLREPGERQEREFRLQRELERTEREVEQLKTETAHLETLTEIQKTRAEIAQAKRILAPRLFGVRLTGGRKFLGHLGELGARQAAAFRGEQTQQKPTIGFGGLNLLGTAPPRQPREAPKPLRFGFYPQQKKKRR